MTLTLVRPHRGPVTQRFGNIQPDGLPHAGQDYGYSDANGVYPEIYAAADGVVLFSGDSRTLGWPNIFYINPDFNRNDDVDNSAGNLTVIGHYENGKLVAVTGYGHQESISVRAGQKVQASQVIGITGDTGYAFGKHLHFFLMFLPYNYATPTYGCSDPNPYFAGSLSLASQSITPAAPEEIDVTAEQNLTAKLDQIVAWEDNRFNDLARQAEVNRNMLAGFVRDVVNAKETITPEQIDAKFQALTAATKPEGQPLFKGDASPEVYAWDGAGGFRHIEQAEYITLISVGAVLRELPQAIIDGAVKTNG